MSDIVGFASIGLICILTYILAVRWRDIGNIIFVALLVRVIVILIGHYVAPLPDSTADARTFEGIAFNLSKEGFIHIIDRYPGPSPRFISWFLSIPYYLFGRSILMAQSISMLFGIGSVFLGWMLAKKIWDDRIAKKVAWTIALFPSLVLYSVLILREVYMVFFLLLALYGVASWVKSNSFKSIFIAMIGFIGAIFFHGAMMVGAIIFIAIIGTKNIIEFYKGLKNYKINIKALTLTLMFIFTVTMYFSNKIDVPYLGTFEDSTNVTDLQQKTKGATRGTASWPEWTKINSSTEMFYKAPIRSIYLIFAPFPWDVNKVRHLVGMFDAFLYMYLSFLILINIKVILKNPVLRIFLIILMAYIFVFGIGVGNFGTGIRHRSKFVVVFILLAAPLLKRFVFFNKPTNT